MRLIDADALMKDIENERAYLINTGQIEAEYVLVYSLIPCISEAPTIDPVRHGYWKETDDPMFMACSVCGYLEWGGLWNNYCPECGAKMDGGEE